MNLLLLKKQSIARTAAVLVMHTVFCSSLLADNPHSSTLIGNFRKCSDRIISGAAPVTQAQFENLAAAGIKTIISVDGARPNLKLARRSSLRYVHIPIGYNGIPPEAALSIAKVVRDTHGKIFIHCHHGKHRGPAAAAIACLIEGSADVKRAKEILILAGTSREYSGLWRDVANFKPPAFNVALPALHEVAPLKPLTKSMAELGREFEALKLAADNEKLRHAVLIHEHLKESFRSSKTEQSTSYRELTKQSRAAALALRKALSSEQAEISQLVRFLSQSCTACHKAYRN